jgi:imidazolonepropionase-like amidohydrolase
MLRSLQTLAAGLALFVLAPLTACAPPEPAPAAPATIPAAAAAPAPAGPDALYITNVTVIPMDTERVLRGHTVVVQGERIAAVAPAASVSVPAGARTVDGTGRYLIPGLAEMHAHIPSPQQGQEVIDRTLFLYVANGVTTARGMLGHPDHLVLRERSARNEIVAPRIVTSGPSINGNSAPNPTEARRMVEAQHAAGYDFLKLHPGLGREVYDTLVATAQRVGIPFAGHVSASVGLDRTLQARQASIDHLDAYLEALAGRGGGYTQQESGFFGFNLVDEVRVDGIPELVRRTREAGVWNAPTQTLIEHLYGPRTPEEMRAWPEMRFVPAAQLDAWVQQTNNIRGQPNFTRERADRYIDVRRRLIRELHAGGAGIILAADAPQIWNVPGFALHREMRIMVESGLTPYQVLATGTRAPATYFGTGEWGTIQGGRVADMILLDADPLADIGNAQRIAGVVLRGHWLPRAELDRRLEAIAAGLRP